MTSNLCSITQRTASLVVAEGPCPTVTSMFDVCYTCCVNDCTVTRTITNPGDCPQRVATSLVYYPCCASTCPDACSTTSYVIVPPTNPPPVTPCPTVTSSTVCATCVQPDCVVESTVTFRSDCPWPPSTVDKYYGCGGSCPTGCKSTEYSVRPYSGCHQGYIVPFYGCDEFAAMPSQTG